jgi:hypothetical protein
MMPFALSPLSLILYLFAFSRPHQTFSYLRHHLWLLITRTSRITITSRSNNRSQKGTQPHLSPTNADIRDDVRPAAVAAVPIPVVVAGLVVPTVAAAPAESVAGPHWGSGCVGCCGGGCQPSGGRSGGCEDMGASPRRILPRENGSGPPNVTACALCGVHANGVQQALCAACVGTWHDPDLGRPIAAPLEQCAELLGVDLATICELACQG